MRFGKKLPAYQTAMYLIAVCGNLDVLNRDTFQWEVLENLVIVLRLW
jgi:hypothetical protein